MTDHFFLMMQTRSDHAVVEVREEDSERVKSMLASRGIEAVVDDDVIGKLGRM